MKNRIKYPRTYHLPFSPGITSDDKVLKNIDNFIGKEIVITEKMDGENTTIYNDYCHARSIDSKHQEYHSWLLNVIPMFQYSIPMKWRICGEYLYVRHSIKYDNLPSYFMIFSVWNENNECLSWDDTELAAAALCLHTVPVLYRGIFDEEVVKKIAKEAVDRGGEGIVVRLADGFKYNDFDKSIAKYVRRNHVQTNEHWSHGKIENNLLKGD